jgi:flavin-dependent dehydrogenase
MVSMGTHRTEVFVAGGGPAGLAAAIAARQQGFRVMLADCLRPPVDKACGEGLMPDSVAALAALGVDLSGPDTGTFRGIRFLGAGAVASAEFPAGHGVGIRRTLLHQALVERAREAGVEMRWGVHVSGMGRNAVLVDGHAAGCDWIIGADGQHSRVRRWAHLDGGSEHDLRIGLRRHFEIAPWSDLVEVYWGEGGQAYVTPIARRAVCVALISRAREESFDTALARFPGLHERLAGATAMTPVKGAATLTRRLRRVTRANVALIGEASGSADAVTGEGLAMSFRQAIALAQAMADGDLQSYERAHRQIAALPQAMGWAMLRMDRHAWLRARALRALNRRPALFRKLLALHAGGGPSASFGVGRALGLGWDLLTA